MPMGHVTQLELETAATTSTVFRQLLETCLSEGASGFWDDCGPCANTAVGRINHLLPASDYNGATVAAIRARDIEHGWFTPGGGQTLRDIHNDIDTYSHHQTIIQYAPYSQPGDWTQILEWLYKYAGYSAILLQALNASALPENQQTPYVHSHFFCVSGYDSVRGFRLINGDQVQASNQGLIYYPGAWCTVEQMIPANIAGAIVVQRDANVPWV